MYNWCDNEFNIHILKADKNNKFIWGILNQQHYVGQLKIKKPNEAAKNWEFKKLAAPSITSH